MKWNIIADSGCDLFKLETPTDNINYLSVPFFINIEEQELLAPKRSGFTVIEWGGTELK